MRRVACLAVGLLAACGSSPPVEYYALPTGDVVQPVVKGMGLKKGEKIKKIGPPIRIVSTRREMVCQVTDAECEREGFPGLSRKAFGHLLTDGWRKAGPCDDVNRIEFEYLDNGKVTGR